MGLDPAQAYLLTVVSPVPLGPDDFSDEELHEYGMSSHEVAEMRRHPEWLLQWVGVPQGLASAAPF